MHYHIDDDSPDGVGDIERLIDATSQNDEMQSAISSHQRQNDDLEQDLLDWFNGLPGECLGKSHYDSLLTIVRSAKRIQVTESARIEVAGKVVGKWTYEDLDVVVCPIRRGRRERGLQIADEIIEILQAQSPAKKVSADDLARVIDPSAGWDRPAHSFTPALEQEEAEYDDLQAAAYRLAQRILSEFNVTK